MRILVVGASAIGGYLGGRLLKAGRDDLLRCGGANGGEGSLLDVAFRHVKAYEARRARNQAEALKAA